jgi:predicted AAA+ superfamily ATPase
MMAQMGVLNMNMDKNEYRPRVIDKQLPELLRAFGGVLITGPKMCGKTWTGFYHANSAIFIDEDNVRAAALTPELVLAGDTPRLVDEWQEAPQLWDKARRLIDSRHSTGLFIFTGSAVPKAVTTHSGTGRFVHLQMRPLSLFESGDSSGSVSLASLFAGNRIEPVGSSLNYEKIIRLICRGGWPAALWLPEDAALTLPRGYLQMVIESDISRVDGVSRNPDKVRLLLKSLARNTATMAGTTLLAGDISEQVGNNAISTNTVDSYLNALRQIFIVAEQRAWLPALRSKTRLRTSPKRHLIDPSLAVAALDATPDILLREPRTVGFLFESLCYRDMSVYAEALGGQVFHYRDEKELEADAIIQLGNGEWAAVEVKLGEFEFDKAAHNLLRLSQKMQDLTQNPAFLMILTATGGVAYTREDGIHVVPLDCLCP